MEEYIEVRYENEEKYFIHKVGVNRGYYQCYPKVTRNYLLSSEAKTLYSVLEYYTQNSDSKECFPGRETLKAECGGWGNGRLTDAINELKDARLIATYEREGKTTIYKLLELQHSPLVLHSELLHTIRKELSDLGVRSSDYCSVISKYKKTELFKTVSTVINPFDYRMEVFKWFETYMNENKPKKIINEKSPSNMHPTFGALILDKELQSTKGEPLDERPVRKKKSRNHEDVDVKDWTATHFLSYFESVWLKHKGLPYPTKLKEDLGALKHVMVQINDNHKVKRLIDKYFEIDLDSSKHSVRNFSSSFVQQKLISSLNSNSPNSYKKNTKNSTDYEGYDEWARNFLAKRGEF